MEKMPQQPPDRRREQWSRERARAERALEREQRALDHKREAEREAELAPTEELSRLRRAEAKAHARAARLHHAAADLQSRHSEGNEAEPDPPPQTPGSTD